MVQGELPLDIVGTYYRNGPALFEVCTKPNLVRRRRLPHPPAFPPPPTPQIGGVPLKHPWDGDGLVAAFSFVGNGSVLYRSRFVRTEGYVRYAPAHPLHCHF
jgi:all-trans-8'-apo-beta-carotenal 15,15'-oxygenase